MKFLVTIFAICLSLAIVTAQQYFLGQFPSRVQRQFGYNTLDLAQPSATQIRDPRQNRGPVVFPPSPPDAIEESSGVVVGASGYGFVPPRQTFDSTYYTTTTDFDGPATSFSAFNFYSNPYYQRIRYF